MILSRIHSKIGGTEATGENPQTYVWAQHFQINRNLANNWINVCRMMDIWERIEKQLEMRKATYNGVKTTVERKLSDNVSKRDHYSITMNWIFEWQSSHGPQTQILVINQHCNISNWVYEGWWDVNLVRNVTTKGFIAVAMYYLIRDTYMLVYGSHERT